MKSVEVTQEKRTTLTLVGSHDDRLSRYSQETVLAQQLSKDKARSLVVEAAENIVEEKKQVAGIHGPSQGLAPSVSTEINLRRKTTSLTTRCFWPPLRIRPPDPTVLRSQSSLVKSLSSAQARNTHQYHSLSNSNSLAPTMLSRIDRLHNHGLCEQ